MRARVVHPESALGSPGTQLGVVDGNIFRERAAKKRVRGDRAGGCMIIINRRSRKAFSRYRASEGEGSAERILDEDQKRGGSKKAM